MPRLGILPSQAAHAPVLGTFRFLICSSHTPPTQRENSVTGVWEQDGGVGGLGSEVSGEKNVREETGDEERRGMEREGKGMKTIVV